VTAEFRYLSCTLRPHPVTSNLFLEFCNILIPTGYPIPENICQFLYAGIAWRQAPDVGRLRRPASRGYHIPREDTVTYSAAEEPSLSLTSRTNRGGYVIAALSGDLGVESAPALREHILGLLRAASHLIIDLSAVEHADANGLAALVGSGRRARLLGGSLRLAAPSPEVGRVLSATGMNRHLNIFPTIRAAITGQPRLPGPIFPAGSYEQRPTRPSAVTTGRQASGRVGRRDVWSRPGEDLVPRARASGWS
jgi:anti-sigma B factor antagonist